MAPSSDEKQVALSEEALIEKEFGVPLETLYRMGVKYYRGWFRLFSLYRFWLQLYSFRLTSPPHQRS